MNKTFLITASYLGALTVALGAFGAHSLKTILSSSNLQIFETGVKYQFYHVLALLISGILSQSFKNNWIVWSGRMFMIGIILFSGSLYLLTYFKAMDMDNMNWLGMITPIGGLCFIAGWICMAIGIKKV